MSLAQLQESFEGLQTFRTTRGRMDPSFVGFWEWQSSSRGVANTTQPRLQGLQILDQVLPFLNQAFVLLWV